MHNLQFEICVRVFSEQKLLFAAPQSCQRVCSTIAMLLPMQCNILAFLHFAVSGSRNAFFFWKKMFQVVEIACFTIHYSLTAICDVAFLSRLESRRMYNCHQISDEKFQKLKCFILKPVYCIRY